MGQLYATTDIDKTKAEAVKENIDRFCGTSNVELMGKYDETSMTNKYVFSAFDNMDARKLMFEKWCREFKECPDAIFIDGRMTAEEGQVYFVTSDKVQQYRDTLFNDEEAPLENCSYKATSHCGALIASFMVSGFNNFITNIKTSQNLRDIPFSIIYQLPILNFDIK
jgi:molybdopterin/thiamine biosynthesis adenylyltransferase